MGHGMQLTEFEQGQIDVCIEFGMSVKQTAIFLKRSRTVVSNYLKSPEHYGKRFGGGRPSKLSDRDLRQFFYTMTREPISAAQIVEDLKLPVDRSTISRQLNSSKKFKYVKMNKAPKLTKQHQERRVQWCEEKVDFGMACWSKIIFSDEKKWNLDGPDGLKSYWHCLGREKKTFFSRQNGGGSVMIWGAIWSDGKSDLAFLEGKQNSEAYCKTLEKFLLPAGAEHFRGNYVFQQDNAPIHTSRMTKDFLHENNVALLDWPALSPDLNPIENVWGYLAQRVYKNGKQYSSKEELKRAILAEWQTMDKSYLTTLISSMKNRCIAVLKANGSTVKY